MLAALPWFAADATFPDPVLDAKPATAKQTLVIAGGCFWCVESRDSLQDSDCFGAVNGAKLSTSLRSERKSHGLIAQNLVHHVLIVPTPDSSASFGLIEPSPNRPPKVLTNGLLSQEEQEALCSRNLLLGQPFNKLVKLFAGDRHGLSRFHCTRAGPLLR